MNKTSDLNLEKVDKNISDVIQNKKYDVPLSVKNYFVEDHQNQMNALLRASFEKDMNNRHDLTIKIFELVRNYIIFVVFMVFFSGIGFFKLSDTVLVALITTSLLNVLGLLAVVLKYFFSKNI